MRSFFQPLQYTFESSFSEARERVSYVSPSMFYLGRCWAFSLQWRHNEHRGVSDHLRIDCLLSRLFKRRSNKISKLRVTGLCEEFPAQRASNAETDSIWWRHHDAVTCYIKCAQMGINEGYGFIIGRNGDIWKFVVETPANLRVWVRFIIDFPPKL